MLELLKVVFYNSNDSLSSFFFLCNSSAHVALTRSSHNRVSFTDENVTYTLAFSSPPLFSKKKIIIEIEIFERQFYFIRDSPVEISEATNLEVVEIGKSQFLKLRSAVRAGDLSRVARESCDTYDTPP